MFGVDSTELLLVAVIALIVIGPKDLPKAMRVVGQWVGRARGRPAAFCWSFALTFNASRSLSRRNVLQIGCSGFAGLSLPSLLAGRAQAAEAAPRRPKPRGRGGRKR